MTQVTETPITKAQADLDVRQLLAFVLQAAEVGVVLLGAAVT